MKDALIKATHGCITVRDAPFVSYQRQKVNLCADVEVT